MSWTHLRDTEPIARKQHLCYLCELTIEKGTRHVCRTGINEDGRVDYRMHPRCEAITREDDWKAGDWECFDPGEFRDDLARSLA